MLCQTAASVPTVRVSRPVAPNCLERIEDPAVRRAPCFYHGGIVRRCGTGAHVVAGAINLRLRASGVTRSFSHVSLMPNVQAQGRGASGLAERPSGAEGWASWCLLSLTYAINEH